MYYVQVMFIYLYHLIYITTCVINHIEEYWPLLCTYLATSHIYAFASQNKVPSSLLILGGCGRATLAANSIATLKVAPLLGPTIIWKLIAAVGLRHLVVTFS